MLFYSDEQQEDSYVWWWRVSLEVGLDGFVLFVELRQVGNEVFDDVGVREGVDAGFLGGVCWDAACSILLAMVFRLFDKTSQCERTYTSMPKY